MPAGETATVSRPRLRSVATLIAVLLAGLANGGASIIAARHENGSSHLKGLWRSRGYGWIWSIRGKRIETFDVCTRTCIANKSETRSLGDPGLDIHLDEGGKVLRVTNGDHAYVYLFDRITALPEACGVTADPNPMSVLDAVDDFFTTHYVFFERRGIDWPALLKKARAQVNADTGDSELFDILKELLSHVPDDHVTLKARIDGRDLKFESGPGATMTAAVLQARREGLSFSEMLRRWYNGYWTQGVARTLLHGSGRVAAHDTIQYGLIEGDIGYLNVHSMEGFATDEADDSTALDKALDGAITLFRGARAVIVDVSLNDGGRDLLARQIAGRFASKRTLGYYKFAGDDPTARSQAIYVEPSGGPRFTGSVYLLTSDVTVSAAEVFTLAMRALPNVTHVGTATRGSLSDELYKRLPNGWRLSLSNEIYLDSDGMEWEGRGIQPKIEMEVFSKSDVTFSHPEAVRAIVKLIRQQ